MPATPGTRFGVYEVLSAVGAGGMGEVYAARDTKLNRVVALKVLPEAFAADADRLARFRREAQVLGSLNHPNIAAIYGFEDAPPTGAERAVHALVMEFVPGETLADLGRRGPLPAAEALPIVRQIAAALEAAHEQGIVHRDLKPANVKVTPDGTVKVLDFGLAKAADAARSGSADDRALSLSTVTSPALTELGVILGTAGYMSPEQAKGKAVDRRTDLWALGVVLFELLSGRPLFRAETVTETIAHVITQPPDWDALPASTPTAVRRLLRRLLEKDPRNRLQSAGDVRIEIDEILAGAAELTGPDRSASPAPPPAWRRLLPWLVSAALLVALAVAVWPRPGAPAAPARLDVRLSTDVELAVDDNIDGAVVSLSPDGRTIVFRGTTATGRRLYARPLDALAATPLSGTENATQQFFSPEGGDIAFFADGQLKRIGAQGSAPTAIAPAGDARGGTWSRDGTIVFAPMSIGGLMRVPASGGAPVPLTRLGPNERTHRWPAFLPDGRVVLFMCQMNTGSYDDGTIEAVRLDTGARTVLVRGGTFPLYVPGYLLYTRQNSVFAVRFDASALRVEGAPLRVIAGVMSRASDVGAGTGDGASQIAVSATGTAVYLPQDRDPDARLQLVVTDRGGKPLYAFPEHRGFRDPRFSPDDRRIAVRVDDGTSEGVAVVDPTRDTLTPVGRDLGIGGFSGFPIWSRDGRQLAVLGNSDRTGLFALYLGPSDGSAPMRAVASNATPIVPDAISADGRLLVGSNVDPKTYMDIVTISLDDQSRRPFLATPANEGLVAMSPDWKWIAYQSDETGTFEVFVRAYPDGSGLRQVSSGGGQMPQWTHAGREIVYLAPQSADSGAIMAVDVSESGGTLTLGRPMKLFDYPAAQPANATSFDATSDGARFVLLRRESETAQPRTDAMLVLSFADDVRRVLGGSAGR